MAIASAAASAAVHGSPDPKLRITEVPPPLPPLVAMSLREAAARYGMTMKGLRVYIEQGRLRAFNAGSGQVRIRWRVTAAAMEGLMESLQAGDSPPRSKNKAERRAASTAASTAAKAGRRA